MTILCGRTRKGRRRRFDGPVVKAIFAALPRAYATAYISVLLFLYRPFRSLIPVRKYSVESLVYTGQQHVHPKTLYNVLLDPVPPFPQPPTSCTRAHPCTRRPSPGPSRSGKPPHDAPRPRSGHIHLLPVCGRPTDEFLSGGMSFVRTRGGRGSACQRTRNSRTFAQVDQRCIGKQSDRFKCRVRPDFNGRFAKSYRVSIAFPRTYTHARPRIRGIRKRPNSWNLIRFRLKNHYSPGSRHMSSNTPGRGRRVEKKLR